MAKGIRIAGGWERKADNGDIYYEGTVECTVRVYSNKYKTKESQPEVVIYLSEKEYEKGAQKTKPQAKPPFQRPRPPEVKPEYTPAPTTKYAGTVPPDENIPPWPDVDGDEQIPF